MRDIGLSILNTKTETSKCLVLVIFVAESFKTL
jgi:hypothetical protein